MRIKLLHEWMSNSIGSILDLIDNKAHELINRGVAHPVESPSKEPLYESKALDEPNNHKMMIRRRILTK